MTVLIMSRVARLGVISTVGNWLTGLARCVAAAARAFASRLLASLEESRRQQAARVIARYRDMIDDPDIAARFGTKPEDRE